MPLTFWGFTQGGIFSTKAHKKYKSSDLHKCSLKAILPTLRKARVMRCLICLNVKFTK